MASYDGGGAGKRSRREIALTMRLAAKQREVGELQGYAADLYRMRGPSTDFTRQVYADPAINVEIRLMRAQIAELEKRLQKRDSTIKALSAKGDNMAGLQLQHRIKMLTAENEALAAAAGVDALAKARADAAVAESYADEVKQQLEEAFEYIQQLEEEKETLTARLFTAARRRARKGGGGGGSCSSGDDGESGAGGNGGTNCGVEEGRDGTARGSSTDVAVPPGDGSQAAGATESGGSDGGGGGGAAEGVSTMDEGSDGEENDDDLYGNLGQG